MNYKKLTAIQILVFISFAVRSQITITSADLPQAGEIYLTSTDTTPVITLGAPSASFQSWNFTSLSEDYPSFPDYGLTSTTPYATAFAASNLYTYGPAALFSGFYGGAPVGTVGMNNGYMFWKTDVSGLRIVGFRADSGSYNNTNVLEAPMELLIGTPATYATAFSNTGLWTLSMNLNSLDIDTFYVNRVEKTLTTDAWGSLTTPTGNYPNVIRIHENLVKVDSVYGKMGSTLVSSLELTRDTLNNYIYMANGVHYPVCMVHADKNNVVRSVEYYQSTVLGIQDGSIGMNANVFPNPVSDECKIEIPEIFLLENAVVSIFDNSGRKICSNKFDTRTVVINAGDYAAGIYFYQLNNSKGQLINGKLIIAK